MIVRERGIWGGRKFISGDIIYCLYCRDLFEFLNLDCDIVAR